jgi:hypothetical protein
LLFPFHWQYRFITPISYWDANHYGNIVGPLEHLLNLGIILYFATNWLRRALQSKQTAPGET